MFGRLKKRSVIRGIAIAAALLMPTAVVQINATGAGLPTVRVVTPDFNPANETFASDGLAQYYAAGGRSFYRFVGAGSTITITYLVTSDGTAPWADKTINFMVNAPYSGSKAAWEVNGTAVGASKDSGTGYGLLLTGKTNADGKVSFTIKNTDAAANAQPIPASETQPRLTTGRLYGNMKAVIDGLGDMQQAIDLITFDITKADASVLGGATPTPSASPSASPSATPSASPSATPTPTKAAALPTMRLVSPEFTSANSVDTTKDIAQWYSAGTKAWYAYSAAGSTLTLKYKVTKDGTAPWAGVEVSLQVNAPYSGSKANWTSGATKIGAPTSESAAGGTLTATTNAAGEVTFVLKNTDTKGLEMAPKSLNAALPSTRLYGTLKPIISGYGDKEADIDLVTFDIYEAPKVTKKTTITCIKGKTTKKVTGVNPKCPSGYKKK